MEEEKQEKVTHSHAEKELSDLEITDEELLKCSQNEEMSGLEDGELAMDDSEWDLLLSKGEEVNQVMGSNECEEPYPLSEEEEKIMLAALVD